MPAPNTDNQPRRLWLDMGDFEGLLGPGDPQVQWQDHGLGLPPTIPDANGLMTDLFSTKHCSSWPEMHVAVPRNVRLLTVSSLMISHGIGGFRS